jgi:hydrogenase maturation protease
LGLLGLLKQPLCFIKKLMEKTLIVGIGNLLCRDEGIGVHVVQEMKKLQLPAHMELLDIGTSTMDLISYLEGFKKLIIIDAMRAGGIPGTIYQCTPEDLIPSGEEPVSLHDIGVVETLTMAKKMGMEIKTVIIGVEPKVLEWGMELSEEVKERIPSIIEAVLKEG